MSKPTIEVLKGVYYWQVFVNGKLVSSHRLKKEADKAARAAAGMRC